MSIDSFTSDQASFIHPRDPSIILPYQRPRAASPVIKKLFLDTLREEPSSSHRIKTYLRLKPAGRNSSVQEASFSVLNDTTVLTKPPKDSNYFKIQSAGRAVHQFQFTKVFSPSVQQKDIFDQCVGDHMKDFILGEDSLLFAYGTTNAGKTFTIQGTGENPGVIPRALDMLFRTIHGRTALVGKYKPDKGGTVVELDSASIALDHEYKHRILQWNWDKPLEPLKHTSEVSDSSESDFISSTFREMQKTLNDTSIDFDSVDDVVFCVWVSFLEVYNECVYDLLEPMGRGLKRVPLKLAQEDGKVFVRDLRSVHVSSGDEAFHVMLYGKANLKMAATNMNSHSSRSHCVFTITLVRYFNSENPTYANISSFSFCDLAGAERVKKTLNVGNRLKESNNINTSLTVLGRCLMILRDNQEKKGKRPIPFRDSKLTRLFQKALTGHCHLSMIVNVSPSTVLFDETMHVLRFSAVAKQIVFEPPIIKQNQAKNNFKKSRFSMLVLQPKAAGPICWDSVHDIESSNGSTLSTKIKEDKQYEELTLLVDSLKEQLQEERSKNLSLERNLRQELVDKFSQMMSEMDTTYKNRLQDLEERNLRVSTWRMNQLEAYYKEKLEEGSKKRRRESEDYEDAVSYETKIQELQEEILHLKSKNSAIQQIVNASKEENNALTLANSKLKFELSSTKTDLESCQRALQAAQREVNDDGKGLLAELQQQLQNERELLAEERRKNQILRGTLDEAKEDFLSLNSDREALQKDFLDLEKKFSEKDSVVATLQQEIADLQDEISALETNLEVTRLSLEEKTLEVIELENKQKVLLQVPQYSPQVLEELHQQLRKLTLSDDEKMPDGKINEPLTDVQSLLKTIERRLESHNSLKSECETLKEQLVKVSNHIKDKEAEILLLSEKISFSKSEIQKLEKEKDNMATHIHNLECTKSKQELLVSENNNLTATNVRLDEEVKVLQKEIKNLLQGQTAYLQNIESVKADGKKTLRQQSEVSNREKENLLMQIKSLQENLKYSNDGREELKRLNDQFRDETKKCNSELKQERCEKEHYKEQLKIKESEFEKFSENREKMISKYEEALKKSQAEVELHKREAIKLQKTLLKSTPTPNKSDFVDMHHHKDLECSALPQRICMSESKPAKSQTKTRSARKGLDFNSYRHKENVSEDSLLPCTSTESTFHAENSSMELAQQDLPPSAVKTKKNRRLFTKSQSDSVSDSSEAIEVDGPVKTSPESFMRRLRNRKV